MRTVHKLMMAGLAGVSLLGCSLGVYADDDDHYRSRSGEMGEESEWGEHGESEYRERRTQSSGGDVSMMRPVLASIPQEPEVFRNECGACHMAYQAELLPGRSWEALLAGLEDHFGEDASLEPADVAPIRAHLLRYSAENSNSRMARRALRRTGDQVYLRISDLPSIRNEHAEHLSPRVLQRDSIRSIANCAACHTTAAQGEYDEDYIRIPR